MADKIRLDKPAAVAELTEQFRSSSATLLTEYRGLTVAQITNLRRTLGRETTYAVAKNTLAKRAAAEAGITGLDALFTGPTALAFVLGLHGSPVPWLAPPLVATARTMAGDDAVPGLIGLTGWALLWSAVAVAGYGWLRRDRI